MKKGVFRNFAKFIGKHLCQSLFFNKVVGLKHIFTEQIRTTASENRQTVLALKLESFTVAFIKIPGNMYVPLTISV